MVTADPTAEVLRIVEEVWADTMTNEEALTALAYAGLTDDPDALDAAVHHRDLVYGLRNGHVDPRSVLDDVLPGTPLDALRDEAVNEHEQHLADAVETLAATPIRCRWCGERITGKPVRDEGQREWLGDRPALLDAWCSQDHHDADAEDYWAARAQGS